MAEGRKIEAIKLYREVTGAGLKEAKEAVEALDRRGGLPSVDDPEFEPGLLSLLRQGLKIDAIKLYRERTGAGLKEAKEAVEALASRHGIAPKGPGCAGVVALALGGLLLVVLGCLF
jgi:ribosomal protein L7/L12